MNYLTPEKSLNLLKTYHNGSKLLLPFGLLSYACHTKGYKKQAQYIDYFNILNIGYHSYVSMSCIITDYVKPKNIEFPVRLFNAKSHILATGGFIYYVLKSNKNL